MRVLVTGASGMLGGGVARALAGRGDVVTVLQRRPSGLGLREILGDVSDLAAVRRRREGQEAVVHLAAKVNVIGRPREYERINVGGTARSSQAAETPVSRGWSTSRRPPSPTAAPRSSGRALIAPIPTRHAAVRPQ